ncbi:peptidoglycan editing factor PgeF [Ursidibacter maritimus]|uniref:Purine nucleoside phosphorylase n=1 Tax=Ursidibacter maritimus TaxID=1331689 RepID=A0A949T5P3_9PAST|nr:peptidoglycan editing factor PgeF [Ursidibacter maritimus]KAE9539205.1 laccase [Ursidibacter maritimus]MBV6523962.1 peptidoglycan editing factor PgeF [Ursidibacter maritimus]MBV6525467.1 peptidoglycan editing factor PgeF [Ursidibacter maritimus]MBV6526937.1 peptidoglycan editing factor PgeF [Ursidibacter maritimus]MBV6530212.1 peptidoglycan editing factor PgeF [Ursidibacter maritimus]
MKVIKPTWSVPNHIHAFTTVREGGVSLPPFTSFNLGDHVGDNPLLVKQNRQILTEQGGLPHFPIFLNQTHSTKVLRIPTESTDLNADAVYTNQPNQVCLVMTADCLPVIFCSEDGKEIAAAHAGWRGLCDGILEATVAEFACKSSQITAWLGPAIGPTAFQVGQDVIDQFCAVDPQAKDAFIVDEHTSGKFLGNLYQIAIQRLNKLGITQISGGDFCTYCDESQFFSYRRDQQTGRMATVIWREE